MDFAPSPESSRVGEGHPDEEVEKYRWIHAQPDNDRTTDTPYFPVGPDQ